MHLATLPVAQIKDTHEYFNVIDDILLNNYVQLFYKYFIFVLIVKKNK